MTFAVDLASIYQELEFRIMRCAAVKILDSQLQGFGFEPQALAVVQRFF